MDDYYRSASPLTHLQGDLEPLPDAHFPPTLLLQALDDPWVPAAAAADLTESLQERSALQVVITSKGGHNGFHGDRGCWGDQLAASWLDSLVREMCS